MKKSFKRIITAMAAAMCAVPMTNILSASADDNTMTRTRSASVSGASVSAVSTTAKRTDSTLKEALTDRNSAAVIATEKIDDTVINGGKLVDREQLEEVIDIRDQINGGIKGLGGRDILGLDDRLSDLLSNSGIVDIGGRGRDLLGLDGILGKDDSITDLLSKLGHLTGKDFGNLGKVTGTMSKGNDKGFFTYLSVSGIESDGKGENGNIHVWQVNDMGSVYTSVRYNDVIITIRAGKIYDPFSNNNGNHASVETDENGITFYDFGDGVTCKASEDGDNFGSCTNGDVTISWEGDTVTVSTASGDSVTLSPEDTDSKNKDEKDDSKGDDNKNGDSNDKKKDDSQDDDTQTNSTPIYDCDGCCTHNVSAAEAAAALAEWTDPLINTGENGRQRTPSDEELGAMLANRIDPLTNTGDSVQQRIPSDEELGAMLADRTDPCVDPVR